MPANIEIKARIDHDNMHELVEAATKLSSDGVVTIMEQNDTFFNCVLPGRRLKLREEVRNGERNLAQLIVYNRADQTGPKFCDYTITRFDQSEAPQLKSVLRQSLGVRGEVDKIRKLVMIGQTRVHFDHVKGLGNFMELEVVLRDDQTAEEGQKIADEIMKNLNVPSANLVAPAYMDLLLEKAKAHNGQ